MDEEFLKILACPVCQGHLELREGILYCLLCGKQYDFHQGIPILMSDKKGSES
jgi:uncharacterized protein YbaR (Trm112 family)